jgi:hypothetical protein
MGAVACPSGPTPPKGHGGQAHLRPPATAPAPNFLCPGPHLILHASNQS